MEPDKLNKVENPPDSSSTLQENDGCSFTNRGNDGSHNAGIFHYGSSATVDPLPFPYMPSPIAPSPLGHVHGTYSPSRHSVHDTHGDLMTDLNQLYNLQNPLVDPNSISMGTGIGNPYTQDLCFPHDNSGDADTSMIDSPFSNHFKISEINRNYPLVRGNCGGGHGMTRQGGDADGSYLRGPRIKNFVGLGGSEMYNPQSGGVLNIDNLDHAAQFGCPKKPDGSFLSLGTRDQTDAKFKSDLSRREIPDEMEGAIFPQLNASHVRQASGNFLNPSQNLWSAYPSYQNNVDGFRSWGNNEGGWTSTTNIGGAIRGTNTGPINRPFPLLQKPRTGIQSSFRKFSDRNLGFVDKRDSTYVNLDPHKPFVGGVPTSSGPFSSSSARLLHSGQIGASGFAYESANFTRASTQPTSDQLQKQFMKTVQNFSPASSMASPLGAVRESSMRQEHSGQLFSTTDGNATVSVGNGLLPKRLGIQMNGNSATQAAGDGLFPKDESRFYPNKIGVQRPSFQEGMPLQFTKDFLGPTSTAGPVIPTAKDYGSAQASIALGGPYRRGIIRPPLAFPQVQRKKIALQPPSHPTLSSPVQRKKIALPPSKLPSSTSPPQTAPAAACPIPDRVPHIKWKDSEGLPQPTGHKCLLCKRDLSFTAEGQVYQPANPPPVAILPCGHTFHDHCLQLITPENQSKDPPCIPCAIGDT